MGWPHVGFSALTCSAGCGLPEHLFPQKARLNSADLPGVSDRVLAGERAAPGGGSHGFRLTREARRIKGAEGRVGKGAGRAGRRSLRPQGLEKLEPVPGGAAGGQAGATGPGGPCAPLPPKPAGGQRAAPFASGWEAAEPPRAGPQGLEQGHQAVCRGRCRRASPAICPEQATVNLSSRGMTCPHTRACPTGRAGCQGAGPRGSRPGTAWDDAESWVQGLSAACSSICGTCLPARGCGHRAARCPAGHTVTHVSPGGYRKRSLLHPHQAHTSHPGIQQAFSNSFTKLRMP